MAVKSSAAAYGFGTSRRCNHFTNIADNLFLNSGGKSHGQSFEASFALKLRSLVTRFYLKKRTKVLVRAPKLNNDF
jgi:hypothetical protein